MKKNIIYYMSALLAVGTLLPSCVSEDPFGQGDGELHMKMVLNHTLTRSGDELTDQSLADKATIYISGSKGLLYKYHGVGELPSSLALGSGSYVAEAWTGDSVPASFDKKFYRGYQDFEITKGNTTNVVLNCRIANVVTSVAPSADFLSIVKDYKVTVGHSRGQLEYTADNADEHGYFMMPVDKNTGTFEPNLTYSVTGTLVDGTTFEKGGTIWNVERAHEYVMNISYTATEIDPYGGAFITVTIDDNALIIEDTVEIMGAPSFSGVGFNIAEPLLCEPGGFERRSVFTQANAPFTHLAVHAADDAALGLPGTDVDFVTADEATLSTWKAAGMSCTFGSQADGIHTARIYLEQDMLNSLSEGVYSMQLSAEDANGKKRERTLTINVSNAGIVLTQSDWSEVYAYSATVHANVMADAVANPGFRYREVGTTAWTTVSGVKANMRTRAAGDRVSATLTGLKPGTRYEYQAICDGFANESSLYFTTESLFEIPNSSFEYWGTSSENSNANTLVPSADGRVTFWDSGNHGSMTMKVNVTTGSSDVKHTGSMSAKLKSQYVGLGGALGKFAAGNLFAGRYKGTDGTDGILEFGRAFNGSRPVKLRGYVYYTPGTVDYSSNDDYHPDVVKGSTDRGIIYCALTTEPVEIRTKASNRTLFDPNASYVLAYGQMIFTDTYGSADNMREFEITLEYRDAARLQRAGYMVLTCSASQYGDYFTGSGSSVMYVDDLEFVY